MAPKKKKGRSAVHTVTGTVLPLPASRNSFPRNPSEKGPFHACQRFTDLDIAGLAALKLPSLLLLPSSFLRGTPERTEMQARANG